MDAIVKAGTVGSRWGGRTLTIVKQWANEEPLVREAFIFGSRARNTHRVDSDLDVAVKVNAQPGDASEYACWVFEAKALSRRLQERTPVAVQLEWYDPVETPHVHMGMVESSIKVYWQSET